MSIRSQPYYWIECDYPGCNASAQESGDFAAWSDVDAAMEEASNSEWLIIEGGGEYCEHHTVDGPDDEDGEPTIIPAPNTFEWRLQEAMTLALERASYKFDSIRDRLNRHGSDDRRAIDQAHRRGTRPLNTQIEGVLQ